MDERLINWLQDYLNNMTKEMDEKSSFINTTITFFKGDEAREKLKADMNKLLGKQQLFRDMLRFANQNNIRIFKPNQDEDPAKNPNSGADAPVEPS